MVEMRHISFYFLFLLFLTSIASAQLGEQGGPLVFNVTLGGSETLNYTILNAGSSTINFTVELPILNTIPNNETPIVKVYPMNGTLAPHSQQVMHVTVFMPAKDKPGLTWSGGYAKGTSGIAVVEGSPSIVSGGMGAVVYAAILKGIIIKSAKPPINILLIVGIVLLAAIIVAGGTLYYYYRKRAVAKAKKELRAKELAELKARARGKARKAVEKKVRARPKAKAKARKAKARRRAR